MTILVIDVAAENGGALTILEQFIEEFKEDKKNMYYVAVGLPHYDDMDNIIFQNYEWVKISPFHRLYFDNIYILKVIKDIKPDMILSLQNKTVCAKGIRQEVYFHNALPISEKRFSVIESFSLWVYQNVIGSIVRHSLRRADRIIVQAKWMKNALTTKWGINENIICVNPPKEDLLAMDIIEGNEKEMDNAQELFYPAHAVLYKNHGVIFRALRIVYRHTGIKLKVILTADKKVMGRLYKKEMEEDAFFTRYVGYLSKCEMENKYRHSVLVFPSYIETVGLPLKEARQFGTTILAADCEYAREALGNYDKAYFFSPSDADKLAELIMTYCKLKDNKKHD